MFEDFANSTLGIAREAELNPSSQNIISTVNPLGSIDYYTSILSNSSGLNASPSRLSADADFELLNNQGAVLQNYVQLASDLNSLFTTLDAGR
jgi:hypothetical protein